MISFCQDLNISYEYHVYENKTIKKVSHKRNGSHITQKTFVKTPKLSIISKNPPYHISEINRGINLTQPQNKMPAQFKKKLTHQRTFSNRSQYTNKKSINQRLITERQQDKSFNNLQLVGVKSIELPHKIYEQRLRHNRSIQLQKQQNQSKFYNFFNQKSSAGIQKAQIKQPYSNKILSVNFSTLSNSQQKTVRILNSHQNLNQSIQTKKAQRIGQKINHHSRTSSFSCYEDRFMPSMSNGLLFSSFSQKQCIKQQSNHNNRDKSSTIKMPNQIFVHPPLNKLQIQNPQKSYVLKKHDNLGDQNYNQSKIRLFNNQFSDQKKQDRIQFYDFIKQNNKSRHILYDADSIVSRSLKSQQNEDQSLSVVQQRNFYFQKQEQQPKQIFKKSIQKYIFFQSGKQSCDKKWILYNNAQQRQNKKIYSIKQFPSYHSKQYMDEYEIYLCLKGKQKNQKVISLYLLQLFTALSNNSQKNIYLVKQPFKYLLQDYIQNQKITDFSRDRNRSMLLKRLKIQSQIKQIFDFLGSNSIQLKDQQYLFPNDFAVCQQYNGNIKIKLHSLYKLQIISYTAQTNQQNQEFNFDNCHSFKIKNKLLPMQINAQDLHKTVDQENFKVNPSLISFTANHHDRHQPSNWCFYHTCSHNLKIYQKGTTFNRLQKKYNNKIVQFFQIIQKLMQCP